MRVTDDHAEPPGPGPDRLAAVRRAGHFEHLGAPVGRRGASLHHVIDPATGVPTAEQWRTVSVAAGSCVDANIASSAAIVPAPAAAEWLGARQLPARLETPGGRVTTIAGWPAEPGAGWPAERGVVAGPTRNPSRAGAAGSRR